MSDKHVIDRDSSHLVQETYPILSWFFSKFKSCVWYHFPWQFIFFFFTKSLFYLTNDIKADGVVIKLFVCHVHVVMLLPQVFLSPSQFNLHLWNVAEVELTSLAPGLNDKQNLILLLISYGSYETCWRNFAYVAWFLASDGAANSKPPAADGVAKGSPSKNRQRWPCVHRIQL